MHNGDSEVRLEQGSDVPRPKFLSSTFSGREWISQRERDSEQGEPHATHLQEVARPGIEGVRMQGAGWG